MGRGLSGLESAGLVDRTLRLRVGRRHLFDLRGEDDRLCLLVIIGVNEQGEKRLLALSDGYRESKASWLSVLQDLQARGLQSAPKLATGDGALGFWAALNEAWPTTQHQRCWVHKTANVLAALPDSMQGKARRAEGNLDGGHQSPGQQSPRYIPV